MDWPVTARTTVPHVRQTIADRELETWLAVDLSASLDFGTGRCLKRDLAVAAAAAITHLTVRGGNRIGAGGRATGRAGRRRGPASAPGRHAAGCRPGPAARRRRGCCARIAGTPSAPGPRRPRRADRQPSTGRRAAGAGRGDLRLPRAAGSSGRGRCASSRCATTCSPSRSSTRVSWSCPTSACCAVVDPETGELHEVQTADRSCATGTPQAAAAQRDARSPAALRGAGAAHLRLRTDSDWLLDIVRFVAAAAARPHQRDDSMIRFLQPWWLLALLPVLALAGGVRLAAAAPAGVRGAVHQRGPAAYGRARRGSAGAGTRRRWPCC